MVTGDLGKVDATAQSLVEAQAKAAALFEAVAAAARAAGSSAPYWLTHETNAAGRRLYDKVGKNQGFIHYGYLDAQR